MADRPSRAYWYSWAPGDFALLARGWPLTARAIYRELMDAQWGLGDLPAEPDALRSLVAATPDQWAEAWPLVEPHFPVVGTRRSNTWLEDERARITEMLERRASAGRKGAAVRWGNVVSMQ